MIGTLKAMFRYDTYRGNGYYWRIDGGSWHGPFETEQLALAHAKGFWG